MQGYSTPSRKRILEYLEENKSRTVTVADIENYLEDGHHCEQHLHLQCTKCGRIFHLECDFMGEIAMHIQREHGFYIECKKSIIYGICKDCVKK